MNPLVRLTFKNHRAKSDARTALATAPFFLTLGLGLVGPVNNYGTPRPYLPDRETAKHRAAAAVRRFGGAAASWCICCDRPAAFCPSTTHRADPPAARERDQKSAAWHSKASSKATEKPAFGRSEEATADVAPRLRLRFALPTYLAWPAFFSQFA